MIMKHIPLILSLALSISLFARVQPVGSFLPTSKKVVVVKFYLPGCPPCSRLAPIFNAASNNFGGDDEVVFLEVSSNNRATLRQFGVTRFPTVIIFKDGREIMRVTGASWTVESLTQAVRNALA
jgi:thiol-disulfide isomerase/thioredoxin